MGGNAFAAVLSTSAFPRMPPAVYIALKSRLLPKISSLYKHGAVPLEAPEKTSYGDVDFIVASPTTKVTATDVNAPHEMVRKAVDALHANMMDGNRTSNFAVPIAVGEWRVLGHGAEEEKARSMTETGEIFYQESIYAWVDINVCVDVAEFERIVFFHGYGDLGMIMGLLARNVGLALGEKGLKMPHPPHPPVELSQSFDEILKFMGWSMNAWKAGFHTKREVFEWAASTKFFDPAIFQSHGVGFTKVKAERKMYREFVQWVEERNTATSMNAEENNKRKEQERMMARESALVHFGKKDDFEALVREHNQRVVLKQVFSGSRVRDWADLGEYWKGVKFIMDAVRERLGGEEGVLKLYHEEGDEGVRRVVLEEKRRLGLSRTEAETRSDELGLTETMSELAGSVHKMAML